jgi:hypothetical protein
MASRKGLFPVVAAALCLALSAFLEGGSVTARPSCADAQAVADAKRTCCFTNPQYSGVCAAEPGKDETCVSILEYLNNPRSQGKTYCENTSIRGGWKQAECAKKSGSATADPRPGP